MSCDQTIGSWSRVGRFPSMRRRPDDDCKPKCCEPVLQKPCRCVSCCAREPVLLQHDCQCGACGKQMNAGFRPVCQLKPCGRLTSCLHHGGPTLIQDERRRACGDQASFSCPGKCVCCSQDCDQLARI